jgi:hypothetical protein
MNVTPDGTAALGTAHDGEFVKLWARVRSHSDETETVTLEVPLWTHHNGSSVATLIVNRDARVEDVCEGERWPDSILKPFLRDIDD